VATFPELFETAPRNWRSRLAVSIDLMREISRHTDPDDLFRAYVRRMADIFPTDRQISVTRRGLDRPRVRIARLAEGRDPGGPYTAGAMRQPVLNGGFLADLLYAGEARVFDDLSISPADPSAEFLHGQRSVMAIPLFDGGAAVSMVVLTREEPLAFPRAQVPELVWMCNLFSRALQAQVRSDRLQAACDVADYGLRAVGDLQHGLIPAALPDVPGVEFAVHYRTADRAGGDLYDFFPLADGKVGVLVADVSGHGVHAAVLLAITHSLAHAYPEPPTRPGKLLAYLNTHLGRHYTQASGSFVTAVYAVFDPATDSVTYAAAGHPPPRRSPAGSPAWAADPAPHGLPLGIAPRATDYPERTTGFAPGDRLALYTDGVVEAADRSGELFGDDRFDAALTWAAGDAGQVVAEVVAGLGRFTGAAPPADDQTLLVARRTEERPGDGETRRPGEIPGDGRYL
jgi:sigma-B regulation protein RsbU (phosphoserine phosphatase)